MKPPQKKFYIETYGCQMNFSDSEIVSSVLADQGFALSPNYQEADIIFVNTCSIRENAEQRIRNRLQQFRPLKKKKPGLILGVLGCMAERLKDKLFEEDSYVDLIVGPDAYRDLPRLLEEAGSGQKAINVILSADETYADINPVRAEDNQVTAFISIMRGCENHCAYCVVPATRGHERSRDPRTILAEAGKLFDEGYRDITLLGQNVNSYRWVENETITKFPELLEMVAGLSSDLRIRFATSHPKDLSDELLHIIAGYENICKSIHLPIQSGSSRMLKLMNRRYDREGYMSRIDAIRRILPGCTVTTDIISGFCSEKEEDHLETISLMKWAKFDYAFMFKYSERPGTPAAKRLADDVPEEIKSRRLDEIIRLQQKLSLKSNLADVGKIFSVLVEGKSKRSASEWMGRTSQNKVVVFQSESLRPGVYTDVRIISCTAATLRGEEVSSRP